MAQAVGLDMVDAGWRPTVENYLGQVTKPRILEAVREAKGQVRMVKVNIDENQQLAAQMRIQSIPAVYAFKDGRPIDGFVGALPESQIKAFVKKLMAGGTMATANQMVDMETAAIIATASTG